MRFHWRHKGFWLSAAAAAVLVGAAWWVSRPPSARELADRVQVEVSALRELAFEHPVPVRKLSRDEWRAYMGEKLRAAPTVEHFWAAMRMIGVYRGPDRGEWQQRFADLRDGASGSYDARTGTFHLMTELGGDQRDLVYAHELNHALQDQHFDLGTYLLDVAQDPNANGDEVHARQAVVEGEAAFIDAEYKAKHAPHARSTIENMATMSAAAANLDESIPPFMLELAMRPYVDGYAFIAAVRQRGWVKVNEAYREYPPVSTEQILHPEKWFAREEPVRISWPAFDGDPLFADWKVVVEGVLGESDWRMVFKFQDLESLAAPAAAGWNGDRYAVLRNGKTGAMLYLACTSWDSPEDATEFAEAYARLIPVKHPGTSVPTRLKKAGNTVWITEGAEGATPDSIDAFMAFNERAQW